MFGPFDFPPRPQEGEAESVTAAGKEAARCQGELICEMLFILLAEYLGESEARQLMVARIEKLAKKKRVARKPSHDDLLLRAHADVLTEVKAVGGKLGSAPRKAAERIIAQNPGRFTNSAAIEKRLRRLLKARRDK
jgi:hypothetical protein